MRQNGTRWFAALRQVCVLAALLCASLAWGADGPGGAPDGAPWRIILQWSPQSQFAGYYVAAEKGMYARRGVQVEVLEGGPHRDPITMLSKGEAHFATMFLTGALEARDQGVSMVLCGQIVNGCNQMVVAWKDEAIEALHDLDGRRVSMWGGGFKPAYLGLFNAAGVRPEIVPQFYTVNLFLRRGVSACTAMTYNEYHVLYQAGVNPEELACFYLRDSEFCFPEDGMYCLGETLKRDPEACRAVVAASLDGWRYAAEHPEEAIDIVMARVREAHIATNRPHMEWMLKTILPSIVPTSNGAWRMGQLNAADYERAVTVMKEYGLITSAPSFEAFCGREEAEGVR